MKPHPPNANDLPDSELLRYKEHDTRRLGLATPTLPVHLNFYILPFFLYFSSARTLVTPFGRSVISLFNIHNV